MSEFPWVDVDYCQFSDWGYRKPTRIWGGDHVKGLESRICDPPSCHSTWLQPNGFWAHKEKLGGNHMRVTRKQKYRIPEGVVQFLLGAPELCDVAEITLGLAAMQLNAIPEVRFEGRFDYSHLEDLALDLIAREGTAGAKRFVQSVVVSGGVLDSPEVQAIRDQLAKDYGDSVFTSVPPKVRPVRGPFGEATIEVKPGASPVKQRAYHIQGERREALCKIVDQLVSEGKLEKGRSAWSSPAFPVPKKRPGEYRLVVDYRMLNDATMTDAPPLPRIENILQRQGKFKIWTVLYMKDGYHQVPLREGDRHFTCMTTPKGTYQWTVSVMGLKNGGAIFQRMMEWVLQGIEFADIYIDDVIIGSTGGTWEECIANHERDVRQVLDRLAEHQLIVDPKKAHLFTTEDEFCGISSANIAENLPRVRWCQIRSLN